MRTIEFAITELVKNHEREAVISQSATLKRTCAFEKMNMLSFGSVGICWSEVALGQRFESNFSR